jgi:DNA replication initiation complex subunit (GINS family)
LPNLLRAEKDQTRLVELPESFHDVVRANLESLKSTLETGDALEQSLAEQDIKTSLLVIKNLMDIRIKKVIKAAVSDAYRLKPEHDNDPMLPEEMELYLAITSGIGRIKHAWR